jgi:vacuolar protein-sorting-associated protein 4
MTDIQTLRKEAIEFAQTAIDYDNKDNYEEACKHYIKAAEKLTFLSKVDENQYSKETYRKKAMEYCQRAQTLKESINNVKKDPQPVSAE